MSLKRDLDISLRQLRRGIGDFERTFSSIDGSLFSGGSDGGSSSNDLGVDGKVDVRIWIEVLTLISIVIAGLSSLLINKGSTIDCTRL